MLDTIILKWKIRHIANVIRKCDIQTQEESILQIKKVLRGCVDDQHRKKYIYSVYRGFRERGLL